MKKINWLVRIKNKMFWLAIIPAVLMLLEVSLPIFGLELNFGELGDKLVAVVNSAFTVLAILGIVVDPTTKGMADSEMAMEYKKPKEK